MYQELIRNELTEAASVLQAFLADEQNLKNIEAALAQAQASLRDVVRVTYVLPRAEDFPPCWPVLRRYFGEIRPAAMMISAGLADPRMRIEIEVTARRGSGG